MAQELKTSSRKAGLPPGTPIHVGERKTDLVRITLTDFGPDHYQSFEVDDPQDCVAFLNRPTTTWINVEGLHQVETIEKIASCFNLHPLTVEDILNTTQRPKLDLFEDYLFLVAKLQIFNQQNREVEIEQVSFVLGQHVLLTFQERSGPAFDSVRRRIESGKGRIRSMGPDYLAYALLDTIVDNYFVVLEEVGEEIEMLEEELVTDPAPETLQKIHLLKREMILLRKSVWPLREVINRLMRDGTAFVAAGIHVYLRDLYDHTIHVIDTVETFRDLISGMLDIYLSSISNRLNEIMKVLTIFAAIFIPLTFVTGLYGMNFNPDKSPWNMPELNWYWGYPFALTVMVIIVLIMLNYFKRKKWL